MRLHSHGCTIVEFEKRSPSLVTGSRLSKIQREPLHHVIFHETVERIVATPYEKRCGNHQGVWFGAHADGAQ
jgi:hypothetical protein